jgi:hypothetical protein
LTSLRGTRSAYRQLRYSNVKGSLTTSGEASTSRKAQRLRQRANTPASVARSKFESPSIVRPGNRRPVAGPTTLRGPACRLFEAAKPWLIVALFLLVLGLAGGVETGTVWP